MRLGDHKAANFVKAAAAPGSEAPVLVDGDPAATLFQSDQLYRIVGVAPVA